MRGTLLILGIAALCAPGAGAQPVGSGCQATPDAAFDQLWSRSGAGWTGGDGTYSVRLPDGRTAWIFGDTFLGGVRGDGSRDRTSAFVHNSLVLQGRPRRGGRAGESGSRHLQTRATFVSPPWSRREFFWPGAGMVERGRLRVLLSQFRASGLGTWDFVHTGNAVATLSLPGLRVRGVRRLPGRGRTIWGAAVLRRGRWTLIYGVEDLHRVKYLKLARARRGHLTRKWQYFNGRAWSRRPRAAARLLSGTSNQFSVVRRRSDYVLVTQEPGFGHRILAYRSSSPAGPWRGPTDLYATPEDGGRLYTYNAVAHPEFTDRRGMLVSYNVNSLDEDGLFARAENYRPRFVRVPVSCLDGSGLMEAPSTS